MTRTIFVLASNESLARHRAISGGNSVYLEKDEARADLAFLQGIDGTQCSICIWAVHVVQYATQDSKITRVVSCAPADEVAA